MAQTAIDEAGNIWNVDAAGNPTGLATPAPASGGMTVPLGPRDPAKVRAEARAEANADLSAASGARSAQAAERQAGAAEATIKNQNFDNVMKLVSSFEALAPVKEYRVSISQFATGLSTAPNATGDNALIYAYAKVMDPASVVRESEMAMAASGASKIEAAVANYKKQFGIAGGGQLSPQVRSRMRDEMANKASQANKLYKAQRTSFGDYAKDAGVDPVRVIGQHDGDQFMPVVQDYGKKVSTPEGAKALGVEFRGSSNAPARTEIVRGPVETKLAAMLADRKISSGTIRAYAKVNRQDGAKGLEAALAYRATHPEYTGGYDVGAERIVPLNDLAAPDSYEDSYLGQALSGSNEGLASVLGAPADLATGVLNLVPRGINALANTNIPLLPDAIGGSQWLKGRLQDFGSIGAPSADPSKQFVRRVGESVGASAIPAGAAGSLARTGVGLLSGLTGGIGGATAQQVAPGNVGAEILGELAGGVTGGAGAARVAQRYAQRGIEAGIPTVPQLKEQAGQLYRAAESRGVVADPVMTQQLADDFRGALAAEGRISPTGRISEVYPKAREAVQLIDDYAGNTMNPTQIQNVRGVVGDALSSPEPAERRLGSILTDVLDQWAAPIAPELGQARGVASRYLTAEQLERARELAGARASQFTGSGFENALRTEYRGLDRAAIKGNARFNEDVTGAIENVARGTPTSNFLRGLGRLAPTGPVSGLGSVGPGLAVASMAGGPTGAMVGGTIAGLGSLGRFGATRMGIRAADQAELIARNGGAIDQAPLLPDTLKNYAAWLAAAQQAKHLTERGNGPSGQ